MKKKYYSWLEVEKAADTIIRQMYKDNWRPDYIVGITRGGLPLATILSHKLNIRMETLKVKLRDLYDGESCETNCWMSDDAFGYVDVSEREIIKSRWDISKRKNILVVDDINDTGATFDWIKQDWQGSCLPDQTEAWNSVWGKNVRFAVMTENLSSEFSGVNYYYDEVNKEEDDVWLVYPYESD
jgi:hypoxanthine phosphoribosyltransferase